MKKQIYIFEYTLNSEKQLPMEISEYSQSLAQIQFDRLIPTGKIVFIESISIKK